MEMRTGYGRRNAEILPGPTWVLFENWNINLSRDAQAMPKATRTAPVATWTAKDEQGKCKLSAKSVITATDKVKVADAFFVLAFTNKVSQASMFGARVQGGEKLAAAEEDQIHGLLDKFKPTQPHRTREDACDGAERALWWPWMVALCHDIEIAKVLSNCRK